MKKTLSVAVALCLSACVYGNPVNNEGFFANSDITKVEWARVGGKGSSCQTNWFFGLIPFGSNSLASAVERGGITKIAYVDTDSVLYLPLLMTRECTNVYGEVGARRSDSVYRSSGASTSTGASAGGASAVKPAVSAASAASKPEVPGSAPVASVSASDYDFPVKSE
jgi:hypothetical protein